MESFSKTFTVHEWRLIVLALTKNKSSDPETILTMRKMAHSIADETGRYGSEGNKRVDKHG